MRKAILAVIMFVTVMGATEPAGAIDDGFRGRYRLITRTITGICPDTRQLARVRFVSATVRKLRHAGPWGSGFHHERGERFPWQSGDGEYVLRYRRRTDSAIGTLHHIQGCTWRVRLVPVD